MINKLIYFKRFLLLHKFDNLFKTKAALYTNKMSMLIYYYIKGINA